MARVLKNRVEIENDGAVKMLNNDFMQVAIREQNFFEINGRPAMIGQILDTVGIELESIGKSQKEVASILYTLPHNLANNFSVHRDGSCEMKGYTVPIKNKRNQFVIFNSHTPAAQKVFENQHLSTYGYELVSIPMTIEMAESTIWGLLPKLETNGDFISERCAIHIHVGMAKNIAIMKNLLILGLWADELFYSISGMGSGKFRGYSNNAIYARPLQNGPYFKRGDSYYQILNCNAALKATDIYEFFAAYGVNTENDIIKYHPARYFSINLYSILLHNTLEFRHFNQSFNPKLVIAITKLCQLFSEIGIKAKKKTLESLVPGNVFETRNTSYYMNKLDNLVYIGRITNCNYTLDKENVSELETAISEYQGIGINDTTVLTHVKDVDISNGIIRDGQLLATYERPGDAGQIDIHNIQYQSILK